MNGMHETTALLRHILLYKTARHGMYAAGTAAFLCVALAVAWWGPVAHEHARLSHEIDARRAEMVGNARAEEIARAQRKAQETIALLEKKAATRASQASLVQEIARLAAVRGMRVISQSFDEGHAQHGDAALYLELGLIGDYGSFRKVLSDIASLPMWLEVVEARIEHAGEGGGQVRAQLRLLTYRATVHGEQQ